MTNQSSPARRLRVQAMSDSPGIDKSAPKESKTRVESEQGGGAVAKRDEGGATLRFQSELPKLPIPPLHDTLQRYLRALEALQTPEDHERTKQIVEEFEHGDGQKLQERLQKYAEGKASFIEAFWDAAYLDQEVRSTWPRV